jgi:hypothetical protein
MSANRRYRRSQARLSNKITAKFLETIKGKTQEEVAVMMENIRVKYGIPKPEEQLQIINPVDIDGTEL